MVVRLLLWNLADSKTTLPELRQHLPALAEPDAWLSNEARERFGLLSYSGSTEGLERVRDLIGKEPDVYEEFDLED